MKRFSILLLFLALILACLWTLFIGKYSLNLKDYIAAFSGENSIASIVIFELRFPRVAAAILIGAALSSAGASYQAMFVNPLVSPGLLGVLSGAGFGAALAMALKLPFVIVQISAFIFGLVAVFIAISVSFIAKGGNLVMLILGGVISGAVFSSLISIVKYLADPLETLPSITYFLMGSLSYAKLNTILALSLPMIVCIIYLIATSKHLNALSLGEDEAKALGINTTLLKATIILAATIASSLSVVMAGIIGWIGLVVPHICRFIYGADNRYVVVSSAILGGLFLLVCDTFSRQIYSYEIPLSVVTSIFGIPIFIVVLFKVRAKF